MTKFLASLFAALAIATGAFAGVPPIPPSAPPSKRPIFAGTSFSFAGDSQAAQSTFSIPPTAPFVGSQYQTGGFANSWTAWLSAITDNGLITDFTNYGYPGSFGGIRNMWATTQGLCTANSTITFSVSAPGGSPAHNAGNVQIPFDSSGHATIGANIVETQPGSGYQTAGFTLTVVSGGSCTTVPTVAYVYTGIGDYGVPGDTTAGLAIRIHTDICPNPPDILPIEIGTNDIAEGVSETTLLNNYTAIITAALGCGIRPVIMSIRPRGGSSGWTQAMDEERMRINRYLNFLASQTRLQSPNLPPAVYVDLDHLEADPTQSNGSATPAFAGCDYDNLHSAPPCAFLDALAVAYATRSYWTRNLYLTNSQNDAYNATNNPAGNLMGGTVSLFLGTGGSSSGGCTGVIATGWQCNYTGTGTISAVGSIETPRTDGLLGQRQEVTLSAFGGGTTDNFYMYTAITTSNITLGTDKIYAAGDIDVSNMAHVEEVGCQLNETGATTGQLAQDLVSGNIGSAMTLPPNSQIAELQEATILRDFGKTASGSFVIPIKTPPIQTQATATGYNIQCYVQFDASGSIASPATITVKYGNFSIRKANVN